MALLQKRNTSNSKENIPTKRTRITLSFAQKCEICLKYEQKSQPT